MRELNFRRFYIDLTTHIGPRWLKKLGYKPSEPRGRGLPANEDYSLAVPFGGAATPPAKQPSVAIVCHLFHAELAPWLLGILRKSGLSGDLYISTDTPAKHHAIGEVLSQWSGGTVTIRTVENRGRDVAPKLLAFAEIYERYDLVLFLHSKKSVHYAFGEAWRDYLVQCLIGTPSIAQSVLEIFRLRPDVGMVFPQHYGQLTEITPIDWGSNFRKAHRLARRMGIALSPDDVLDMPSGSMFWARPGALRPLLDLKLKIDDFPGEYGQLDGTLAHAIERLFLHVCAKAGYRWVKVTAETEIVAKYPVIRAVDPLQIDAFVDAHGSWPAGESGHGR